jgi:hypothetical protein
MRRCRARRATDTRIETRRRRHVRGALFELLLFMAKLMNFGADRLLELSA